MTLKDNVALQTGPSVELRSKSATQSPICLVCGGQTVKRFSKEFHRTDVHYFMCQTCYHLTAGEINTDPAYGGGSYFKEIDTGWEKPHKRVLDFVRWISRLPSIHLSAHSMALDFGCGACQLVEDLNRIGFNAYGFEPFSEGVSLSDRVFTDWSQTRGILNQIELVTCIEVLEHLRDPHTILEKLSRILVPSGYLLISTETYDIGVHTEDWYYLNPEAGHASIFSEKSLRFLLLGFHFEPILRISGSVWLFRNVTAHPRKFVERGYFALSQLRVKSGLRLNYRDATQISDRQDKKISGRY